jgi:hypothetical protein
MKSQLSWPAVVEAPADKDQADGRHLGTWGQIVVDEG